jgi:hypothetical protein
MHPCGSRYIGREILLPFLTHLLQINQQHLQILHINFPGAQESVSLGLETPPDQQSVVSEGPH